MSLNPAQKRGGALHRRSALPTHAAQTCTTWAGRTNLSLRRRPVALLQLYSQFKLPGGDGDSAAEKDQEEDREDGMGGRAAHKVI
jgi:hypothetical protein